MPQSGILSSHQKSVDFAQRAIDLGLIGFSWWVFNGDHELRNITILMFCVVAMAFELGGSLSGIYQSQRSESLGGHLMRVATTAVVAFLVLAIAAYFYKPLVHAASRAMIAQWSLLSVLLLCSWRLGYRTLLGQLRSLGLNTRNAAVVGSGPLARKLIARLEHNRWMGINVSGYYSHEASSSNPSQKGGLEQLLQDARHGSYDCIYLALPLSEDAALQRLVTELANTTCSVYLVPDIFTFDLLHSRTQLIDGLPAISIYDTPFSMADQFLKRCFDLVVSSMALLLLSPVLLGIAVAIKLTSPGPVFFRQSRYGLNGRPIKVWKFRSMKTMDNGPVVQQAQKNDPRLTPIGGFLRRSSLDELPQFINVLTGSMSVVGPRPHAVAHNEQYRGLIPGYMLRHKVKPGITGWAQVNGWRGETDTLEKMEKRIEFDIEYIRRWSLWLDIKIVLMTALKGFFGKNAY
ncbi:MAG: undecaprenyl-phosphate glucose phosphotransferase [Perlucidibaca sp.]